MDRKGYVSALHENAELLGQAGRRGFGIAIPSCPEWRMGDLLVHVGGVHRTWTRQLRERGQEFVGFRFEIFDSVPGFREWIELDRQGRADPDQLPEGVIGWYEEGAAELENVLGEIDPDEPVWNWSDDHRAWHYHRMMAFETTVHRWDAQNALGDTDLIDPQLATVGIDHQFEVMLPWRRKQNESETGNGETYHFHRTDGEGEWVVRFDGNDISVRREHARGDVAVRGAAADLFLFLWGRLEPSRLEVLGDASLLERYRELAPDV